MNGEQIQNRYKELNLELKDALSRMEHTDRVFRIRESIKELQSICPHSNGSYDFSNQESCPYCGKKFNPTMHTETVPDKVYGIKMY